MVFRIYLTSPLSKDETRVVSSLELCFYLKLTIYFLFCVFLQVLILAQQLSLRVPHTLKDSCLTLNLNLSIAEIIPNLLDKSLKQGRNTCRK